jgi:hypothetical protein
LSNGLFLLFIAAHRSQAKTCQCYLLQSKTEKECYCVYQIGITLAEACHQRRSIESEKTEGITVKSNF